jgi:hypothetical protein
MMVGVVTPQVNGTHWVEVGRVFDLNAVAGAFFARVKQQALV